MTMARFSEAFLILAGRRGDPLAAATPVILVGLNVVYTLTAIPPDGGPTEPTRIDC